MEHLKEDNIFVLKKFRLHTKFLMFVTDQGSNIKAAVRLVILELGKGFHLFCMLHCIHNLIYVDVLKYNVDLEAFQDSRRSKKVDVQERRNDAYQTSTEAL